MLRSSERQGTGDINTNSDRIEFIKGQRRPSETVERRKVKPLGNENKFSKAYRE